MEFDIFGIAETNIMWKKVQQKLQFKERVKRWWNPSQTRSSFAYNSRGLSTINSIRQQGGTAQISRGNAALKFQEYGEDPRGLGRWVWHLYRGKDNCTLRVITAYRSINHKNSGGSYTVWAQHRRHFNSIGKKNISPSQIILDDLAMEIKKWKLQGDHIVLMMDCNGKINQGAIKDFLSCNDLIDAIADRHGTTQQRTHIEGSYPIDGIFISKSVAVTAGGYTAFTDGVMGERVDHRCLWIDVQFQSVLGHTMPGPMKFAGRRVKANDIRVVKKFNKAYKKFAIDHGLSKKIFQLEKMVTYPMPKHLEAEAEKVAALRYQGLEYADKRCRRLFLGKVPFTPQYKKLINEVKFWKYAIKKKQGKRINSKHLGRLLGKASIFTALSKFMSLSLKEMYSKSNDAYKRYRLYMRKADKARSDWLESLAEARAIHETQHKQIKNKSHFSKKVSTRKQATSAELRKLKTQEAVRTLFGRISSAIGKENLAGILLISIPDGTDADGNTTWKEISSHEEIVSALIQEHSSKYHQTEQTPPMVGSVQQQLGYLGVSDISKTILDGTFSPAPGTDYYSKILLSNLGKVDPSLPDLPVGISGSDYSQGWKKAKEKTSAGGSILHFGHCKSMAQDPQLSDMEAAFLSIPLRSGYAYQQWRKGIDCVLPKKANSFWVNKLRTIVLLEADFNFTNKFVARKTAKRAEAVNGMAKEQFGSRKRHRSIDHAWNKQLTLDLLRQLKIAGTLVPNDLKSCYDRICHSIASLCMQRQGVAESEVVCMFSTLQHLEHTIRCAYGDSERKYGGQLWAIPMQGVYQGNGAGPVVWAVVSSPVLHIMREAGYGTFFRTALSDEEIRMVGYAFVDDTDLIQTAKLPSEPIESVIKTMQKGMDLWEGLIKATGGALSVDKCCWWAIDFTWKPDGTWRYKTKEEIPGALRAIDFDGTVQTTKRFEVTQALETLGVFLAPNGDPTEEIKKLKEKAQQWADRLRTAHLREQETATALKATILKTLEYPLLTLHLDEKEADSIMRPILHAALPKSKFNRHFCRRTLFGLGSHLGVEIHNLHTSQIIEHVDGMLRHGPYDSLSGQLLRASIEAVKLEVAMPGDLFSLPFKKFGHLATDCWVKRTWKELENAEIKFEEKTHNLELQRINDSFLIPKLVTTGQKGIALRRLNRCRLFLQVNTVSDLCTGDGTHILPELLEGNNPMQGSSQLNWPNQGQLTPDMWRSWRRALRRALRFDKHGKLPVPLGRWTTHDNSRWTAWHCTKSFQTFVKEDLMWRRFQHQPITFSGQEAPEEIPSVESIPASAFKTVAWMDQDGKLQYHKYSHSTTPKINTATTLQQAIQQLDPELRWITPFIQIPSNPAILASALQEGTAIAVADGSFKNKIGTSGFCITNSSGGNGFYGANLVPGDFPDDHCSYRSELAGILGILVLCQHLCQIYHIPSGTLSIGCDNLEAGKHAIQFNDPPRPTDNHSDLLAIIYQIKTTLPIKLSYRYVEGHQRERYPDRKLDIWACLNDRMDNLAKAFWIEKEHADPVSQRPLSPYEWRVTIDEKRVCKFFKLSLRRLIEGRRMEKKWTTPSKSGKRRKPPLFGYSQIQCMDFNNIQRAWQSVSGNWRRFVAKLAASLLPVGRNMDRMKFWPSSRCPCCLGSAESTPHMLYLCSDPRVQKKREDSIDTFQQLLIRLKTSSKIGTALINLLKHILLGQRRLPQNDLLELRPSIAAQTHLGLTQLLYGRLATDWANLQHKAYTHFAPWLSGDWWAKQVVVGLWDLSFSIWDHRNKILHETDIMDEILDMDKIDLSIIEEWHLGSNDIPQLDRHYFKHLSLDSLLAKRSSYRRAWLSGVQMAQAPGNPDLEKGFSMDEPLPDNSPETPSSPSSTSIPFTTSEEQDDEASISSTSDTSVSSDPSLYVTD